MNRIQKLLFSEYCDFEDVVLLESPFAETTREGKGIRQIQLGVTPTKMIMAEDYLRSEFKTGGPEERKQYFLSSFQVSPNIDPDTETLELVSVIPIECVNLSVFHRRKKHTLKARLCNGQVLYFELGGFHNRQMLWNLWREKVKFLSPEEDGSSVSETSAASSSTCSSLYLVKTRSGVTSTGVHQVWNLYGKEMYASPVQKSLLTKHECDILKTSRQQWTDRNLFPTEFNEKDNDESVERRHSFQEYGSRDLMEDILEDKHEQDSCEESSFCSHPQWSLHSEVEINPISMEERREDPMEEKLLESSAKGEKTSMSPCMVNRFGVGVHENCGIGLYLYPLKASKWEVKERELLINKIERSSSVEEFTKLMDVGVEIWEQGINSRCSKMRPRHFRRYGLMPCPQFNRAMGPFWESLSKGDKHSVQSRLIVSSTELNMITSPDVNLPCPRNHLTATISYEPLTLEEKDSKILKTFEELMGKYPPAPLPSVPIFFWTTDLSFWPRPAHDIYMNQQSILKRVHKHISSYRENQDDFKNKENKEGSSHAGQKFSQTQNGFPISIGKGGSKGIRKLRSTNQASRLQKETGIELDGYEDTVERSTLRKTRKLLRLHVKLTAWDFNSATLAHQLTMIDKDLFLQIPVSELGILVQMKSHLLEKCFLGPLSSWQRAAPCFGAFVAFSHRVSCLVSTEVMNGETVKVRARLIARFINAANKCYLLQNFQSCQSILSGLQSPGIYRLQNTWNYLRLRHANKYEAFELLSKFFRDPRLHGHHHTLSKDEKRKPFIPSAHFMIFHWIGIAPYGARLAVYPFEMKAARKHGDDWMTTGMYMTETGCELEEKISDQTNEGGTSSKKRLRAVQRLISSFKIWPLSKLGKAQPLEEQDAKFRRPSTITIKEQHKKASSDSISKNNWSSWLHENAPELSGYFERIPSKDGKEHQETNLINIENNCDHSYAWGSSSSRFDKYRMEMMSKSTQLLLSSQYAASNYALFQSDIAREYLLKARYIDHKDNYFISFQVESV